MLTEGQEISEGRFKVIKKLGSGAFGEIYKGKKYSLSINICVVEKKKTGEFYAAKIEKATKYAKHVMLFWESKLIHKLRGKTCVPGLHYVGTDNSNESSQFHVMIMDMLGPSLEDLFQACKRQFDLKTLKRIEKVHDERIIHRDIKPDNFLIGITEQTKDSIFIIDFGLAKCYKNTDGQHIKYRDGKNLTGTARYASINTHKGVEQSRRDDLETIGHVLLYFLRGSLPWQGLPGRSKNEKYNNIKKKKIETSLEELCKGYPPEFKEFMEYCRNLKFEEDPDYKYVIGIFEKCMTRHGYDLKSTDYTWKQNRLSKDKEALKNSVLNVIKKKPNEKKDDPQNTNLN
ncbi:UNKNOWN [Stylonychia lemnae]|uniref:Casein kinase I n=1 Tax=Stylonychia lemnae TaxID=5949 RepID=A0A078B5M3_STYLE|nr:UNKNOWN [Stylonychia lemnae]|eukprot:CDW89714.1 UNKNOWN [Stylonychia lemnae]